MFIRDSLLLILTYHDFIKVNIYCVIMHINTLFNENICKF